MASSGPFHVVEHRVPCQHIREYPGATSNEQEDTLYLAVKQYIPVDNPEPCAGDVTVIGAHANGFPKELYEPLWEEIHARAKSSGFRIRSIWMADVAHQGQSGVWNEDALGNDPSWFDHSRDLLHLVNVKRAEMPRPIVGIGHSMGGAQLAQLSLIHPRLIHTLILLDPVIQRETTQLENPNASEKQRVIAKTTQLSTYRRDIWPSRQAAAESFKRSPFYQAWDPRVLDRWVKYGLRDLPTAIHALPVSGLASTSTSTSTSTSSSSGSDAPVTLTTTLHQEVFTFSRPSYTIGSDGGSAAVNRVTHPDLNPQQIGAYPFYRPEPARIFAQLPHLRPSVLYVFGGKSEMSAAGMRADKMRSTGTGLGGSGGAAEGRVREVCFADKGHLLAQEAVGECADEAARWLAHELQRWRAEDAAFRQQWRRKTRLEKLTVDAEWKRHVPAPRRKTGPTSKL